MPSGKGKQQSKQHPICFTNLCPIHFLSWLHLNWGGHYQLLSG